MEQMLSFIMGQMLSFFKVEGVIIFDGMNMLSFLMGLMLSSDGEDVIIWCYYLMLSFDVIIFDVIIWCYHLVLSFMSCYHLMLSFFDVII